nr:suppressor of lurcher protein 1-like [Halyomorpha halys]
MLPHVGRCSAGDYLVVYPSGTDGAVNEESAPLGRLCGSEAINLYSSGPSIVLEFHTEVNIRNSTGFNGKFTFIQADGYRTEGERVPGTSCDYLFSRATPSHNSSSGVFYSPGYPSSYPRKARCAYSFRARPKERVKIIFEELDFQKGDVSCLDREDVIKVHDGGSALSPVIAVLCNQMSRTEIISSSHQIFIEMATSSYWPGHGFVASYHFLTLESRPEDEENKAIEGPAVSATRYSCEVLIRSEYRRAGTVTSPGYPGPNLSGSRCRYAFIGSGKERIRIHVKHYNPSLYSCGIQLFNHMEGKRKPIAIPCLQAGPWLPIMSSGHRLEIDLDNETTIFRAEYIFLKNYGIKTGRQLSEYPCAFRYSADDFLSGSFHSPNFPGPYPIATECHYFFHGARGHRIRIHFSYFDMDGVSPCNSKTRSDYIEFFNFPDRLSRRHCGQLEPFEVLLERRFFRVTFRSGTKRGMGTGFNASYQFLSYPKPAHHGLLPVSSSAKSLTGIIFLVSMITFILTLSTSL